MESEAQYRELVESANSVILRFNIKGRITFCNKFTERLFGYAREELVGHLLSAPSCRRLIQPAEVLSLCLMTLSRIRIFCQQ